MSQQDSNSLRRQLIVFIESSNQISPTDKNHIVRQKVTPKISDLIKADMVKTTTVIQKELLDSIEIYFGIGASTISSALIQEATERIFKQMSDFRVEDIKHAFKRANIERDNNWRNITIQQIMNPLNLWNNNKKQISGEFLRHQNELKEEMLSAQKDHEFKMKSLDKYREHIELDLNEWSGTIYEASSIADNFIKKIPLETIEEMQEESKKEFFDKKEQIEAIRRTGGQASFGVGMTERRIFSVKVIEYALENKIQI